MIATALGLCLSVVTVTPQDPPLLNGNQDRVLMTYPLRNLVGVAPAPTVPPVWTFLEIGGGHVPSAALIIVPENRRQIAPPEAIADLLRTMHRSVADDDVLLLQLQERWVRNTDVEIQTILEPAAHGFGPLVEVTGADNPEQLHHVVQPALTGRAILNLHGTETLSLREMDVEIAQSAAVANPIVDTVFSGIYGFVLPYGTSGCGLGIRTEIDLAYTKELQAHATRSKDGGDLYLPSTGLARYAHSGPIESGQFMDMGTGPVVTIDHQTYRTRQRMRVTLR